MMWWYYQMQLYTNPYYLVGSIGVLIAAILGIWAQTRVRSAYSKYKRIPNQKGITGAQVAREILDRNGLYDIQVLEVRGELSDHYHPTKKTVNLSHDIYSGTSIAAVSVAAHECGHAIQHKEKYWPMVFRGAILPFANVGQYLGWFAIFIGLIAEQFNIAWFGLALMSLILVFQLATLPVEFNASKRALAILETGYLSPTEYVGAKDMLSAAALTYVAAMIQTLMSILRLALTIFGSSNRNQR